MNFCNFVTSELNEPNKIYSKKNYHSIKKGKKWLESFVDDFNGKSINFNMKVVHLDIKFWFIWNTKIFYYIRIDVNNTYKKPNRPHIKSFGHVGKTVSLCKVIQSEILRSNIEFKMKFFGLFLVLMAIVLLAAPDAVAAKKLIKGKKGGKDQLNLSERKFSNFISLQ